MTYYRISETEVAKIQLTYFHNSATVFYIYSNISNRVWKNKVKTNFWYSTTELIWHIFEHQNLSFSKFNWLIFNIQLLRSTLFRTQHWSFSKFNWQIFNIQPVYSNFSIQVCQSFVDIFSLFSQLIWHNCKHQPFVKIKFTNFRYSVNEFDIYSNISSPVCQHLIERFSKFSYSD